MSVEHFKGLFERRGQEGPLAKMQEMGWRRFSELGLPTKEKEAYRYVRLQELSFAEEEGRNSSPLSPQKGAFLTFVDGNYREDLSETASLPKEVVVLPLTKAWRMFGNFLQGRITESLKKEQDPFAALNCALCHEGLFLYVPPYTKCHTPLSIVRKKMFKGVSAPRIHLCLGSWAELQVTLDDRDEKEGFQTSVIDLLLEEGASLHLSTLMLQASGGTSMEALRATLKKQSTLHSLLVTKGKGGTFRYEGVVTLEGERAEANLKGITRAEGSAQAHAHLLVEHKSAETRSLQKFKNVLDDCARTSFSGKIVVRPEAQKTEAYQMNANLLLSEKVLAASRPNLEIFADDVKASHGSTVGQLDAEHLFYLKTRGVGEKEAKKLLVAGFCRELLGEQVLPSFRKEAQDLVLL